MSETSRVARIFISSTFRDFGEERDLLVKRVFPALRSRLKDRHVELVDIDLRWGITEEQAERGEVLPICLMEIDRARPFFVGLLGDRYGWVPTEEVFSADLMATHPWLKEHQAGKSVTEMEILHGVLNNPHMTGRAFFYYRSREYALSKGQDFLAVSEEAAKKQGMLKDTIRQRGFPILEDYPTPEDFADKLHDDLWNVLDKEYPESEVPDEFQRQTNKHNAYAVPRRRLFIDGGDYINKLDKALGSNEQRLLIKGQSGGGKSALMANWASSWRLQHPKDYLLEHYTASSADASMSEDLVRRLIEFIKRTASSADEIATDKDELFASLPVWLSIASSYAEKHGGRWVFALDALNGLQDTRDLRWLPTFLPQHVHIVVSTLAGEVEKALEKKGRWRTINVKPLSTKNRLQLMRSILRNFNKTLPKELEGKILKHPLVSNPLFLKTLAEELRTFGVHEELTDRIDYYLTSKTVDDLFERVLERVEGDFGEKEVKDAMVGIWGSRYGLSETELFGFTGLVPATWAPIYHALEEELLDSSGQITFAHDFMRIAVSDRYLEGNNSLDEDSQSGEAQKLRRNIHIRLAKWFEGQLVNERSVEEIPYQWQKARRWSRLKESLTNLDMFDAFKEYKSDNELLTYWLVLEDKKRGNIEDDYETAWKAWKLKTNSEDTATRAAHLSAFLTFAGLYGDFNEKLQKLRLKITKKIFGDDLGEIANCLGNMGGLFEEKGKYSEARKYFKEALEIRERFLGPDHLDTALSLSYLGNLLLKLDENYEKVETLYIRAKKIKEKQFGLEHPDTATILNNLGALYRKTENYSRSEEMYRIALEGIRNRLGEYHPDFAHIMNNLGVLLEEKNRHDEAEELYRTSLTIREKCLGKNHPLTAVSLYSLANLLLEQSFVKDAEKLLKRCLEIREKSFGAHHPAVANVLASLGNLYKKIKKVDRVLPYYQRCLEIREKALGIENPDTNEVFYGMIMFCLDMDYGQMVIDLYRRNVKLREKFFGPNHVKTADALEVLAENLSISGDSVKAVTIYERALAIKEKSMGRKNVELVPILGNLRDIFVDLGDLKKAEPMYSRVLSIFGATRSKEDEETLELLHDYGILMRDLGNYKKAMAILKESDKRHSVIFGKTSLERSYPLSALGKTQALMGNSFKAKRYYKNALKIRKRHLKPSDQQLISLEKRLTEIYDARKLEKRK